LKELCEHFEEANPGLLEKKIDVEKITGADRLKQYMFGRVLGEGANAVVYSVKDENNELGALK
jgi:hypothetical protein